MKRKIMLAVITAAAVAAGVFFVSAGTANAAQGDCKYTTTQLQLRPDSGNGTPDIWALDNITRVVKICQGDAVQVPTPSIKADTAIGYSYYTATVEDTGTFTTYGGTHRSPGQGVDLTAGAQGGLKGSFTVKFVAVTDFLNFKHVFDGKTYSGTAPSSTSDFVMKDWGGPDFYGLDDSGVPSEKNQNGFQNDWTWSYWTCTEKWTDAYSNNAGKGDGAGDITGKDWDKCPTPTPSATTASPTPSPTATTPAPVPTTVTTTVTVTG